MTKYWFCCAALSLGAAMGCANWGTGASLRGVPLPILLGPVDRVGGGTPLPVTKVFEFDGEASRHFMQGSYSTTAGNMVTTTSWQEEHWSGDDAIKAAAWRATKGDLSKDIHVTKLKAKNYVIFFGTAVKAYVAVEGDVMSPGGGR